MTWPTLAVRIGPTSGGMTFILGDATDGVVGTSALGSSLDRAWVDVTDDVVQDSGVTIDRGSSRQQGPVFKYEAGRCQFTLDNRSGDYDPSNLTGPYVTGGVTDLVPGMPISVQATYGGSTFDLFTGFVDSWSVTYPGVAVTTSVATVTATDAVGWLTASSGLEVEPVGAGEDVATRLNRIMDWATWYPGLRNLTDLGLDSLQATTLSGDAWSQMQLVAESVGGYLWVDPSCNVVFERRASVPQTADLTFGEGNIPVEALQVTFDYDQLYNTVSLQRVDGVTQTVSDPTSMANYGTRTFSRTDLVTDSDDQVQVVAVEILSRYHTPLLRVEAVTASPDDSEDAAVWVPLLSLDLLQRTAAEFVTPDGRSVSRDGLVRSVQLDVRQFSWRWQVGTMTPFADLGDFVLDSSSFGILDQNTLVFS